MANENNQLKLIEDGFIKIYETTEGNKIVDGRELWEKLNVKQDFSDWIKKQLELVDAIENEDFSTNPFKRERQILIEYTLKVSIAKEICMVAGASPRANKELKSKSKQCRKYFIDVEKKYKKLQQDIIDQNELIVKAVTGKTIEERMVALGEYNAKITKQLEEKDNIIKEQKPKVDMADRFIISKGLLNVGEVAKLFNERLGKSKAIGRNNFYDILRNEAILMTYGAEKNNPQQRYINQGYFELKTSTYNNGYGENTTTTTKVTEKGVEWLWKYLIKKGYINLED